MTIQELKQKIESSTIDKAGLVFSYKKSRFLVDQYVNALAKLLHRPIVYENEIVAQTSIWGNVDDGNLYVYVIDDYIPQTLSDYSIVLTHSTNDSFVCFPELEQWQIRDYVYSLLPNTESALLDKLIGSIDDIYHLQNEIDKLCIFDKAIQRVLGNEFLSNNVFSGISSVELFDFSNAVQNRDFQKVSILYEGVEKDPMPFVGILCKQFRNMVNVYLQNNPTEQNTGLKDRQIWAIKNVCKKYTKQEIFDRFKLLLGIDYRLKSGELSADIIFDYVLVKLFS